ncbi:sugar ABC transporter permease [Microbacterium sp. STN6]|uniref:carbohydrate ABC transporter permease n=1 Tax=Microbacterium sp. STN6 TaxID=2995588 RepID=UPI00226085AD|nr:sugar ABC transporter permease [Microbacterium sp. STN6]MCX7522540.1 sugar ABC transporter permease [Microbacterium sp. STN6]
MTVLETKRGVGAERRHPRSSPRTKSTYRKSDAVSAWLLLAPALILFITFIIIPTIVGFGLSFYEWNFFDTPAFIGVANFVKLATDSAAWASLGVTLMFVLLGVIPTIAIGFMLAVLINANMPGVGVLRVLYFVPVVLSVAVSAVLWAFIYDPRQGPIGALLRVLGLPPVDILNSDTLALPALVIMMIWLALPIVIILYLAGLQRVPEDIYSAAALDGAGPWRTLWQITWPNVASTTFVVAILQIVNYVASSLDVSLIMTNGGPLGATTALSLYAYRQAFSNQDVGYASVLSVLQLVIIVAIIGLGRLVTRRFTR